MLAPAQILAESFFDDHDHLVRFQTEYLPTLAGLVSIDTALVLRVDKASFEWEI